MILSSIAPSHRHQMPKMMNTPGTVLSLLSTRRRMSKFTFESIWHLHDNSFTSSEALSVLSSSVDALKLAEKLAQAPESEPISPVVPLENGSA